MSRCRPLPAPLALAWEPSHSSGGDSPFARSRHKNARYELVCELSRLRRFNGPQRSKRPGRGLTVVVLGRDRKQGIPDSRADDREDRPRRPNDQHQPQASGLNESRAQGRTSGLFSAVPPIDSCGLKITARGWLQPPRGKFQLQVSSFEEIAGVSPSEAQTQPEERATGPQPL